VTVVSTESLTTSVLFVVEHEADKTKAVATTTLGKWRLTQQRLCARTPQTARFSASEYKSVNHYSVSNRASHTCGVRRASTHRHLEAIEVKFRHLAKAEPSWGYDCPHNDFEPF